MQTTVIKNNDLTYASGMLKNGKVIAVPTETVYGLAADAFNTAAVEEIYRLKGRPEVKPLSILVSCADMAKTLCEDFGSTAQALTEAFWPGPLTIILPSRKNVPPIITAGGDTVGVRCPDHPLTLELIRSTGIPIAAPSANLSGMPAPKNAGEALKYFDGLIPCVIDGGDCTVGVESTIVRILLNTGSTQSKKYEIIRRGALREEDIKSVLDKV